MSNWNFPEDKSQTNSEAKAQLQVNLEPAAPIATTLTNAEAESLIFTLRYKWVKFAPTIHFNKAVSSLYIL